MGVKCDNILVGLTATDVIGFIFNNRWESFGQIVAWAAEVHYYEQGGHKRADWGQPVYVIVIPPQQVTCTPLRRFVFCGCFSF